ncbi:DUF4007 family protein [Thiomicrospira microaerophila]|uniref:DUF4007 family protein n=1 Tax=Thiomicrospira microaerophila TaxID=406020 RepID=UPI0006975DEB|nr:DUF4007 family protein [Thiomicrospira microaerophila]
MNNRFVKTKFSGHETFPLRYGWLYKGVKYLTLNNELKPGVSELLEKAVVDLGIGKNMVSSMKYWLEAFRMTETVNGKQELTCLAKNIFNGSDAWDPYLENIGTLWLLHWELCSQTEPLNSYRWFFNYVSSQSFSKESLLMLAHSSFEDIEDKPSPKTLEKDIDCLLNSYVSRVNSTKTITEDSFSCPLQELGLISQNSSKSYIAAVEKRPNFPIEVFTYSLVEFWRSSYSSLKTISYEDILYKPGSPGKVFRLSVDGLNEMLDGVSLLTQQKIDWTDTQGLRQIKCEAIDELCSFTILQKMYQRSV